MAPQKKQENQKVLLVILFNAFLGGGLPVLTKLAVREVPPLSFTFLRFFIASLCILPFLLKERPKPDRRFAKAALVSLLGTINVTLFTYGIQFTQAFISQLLYTIVPVIVAVFSNFLLNEIFGAKKIAGIIVGLIGAAYIILSPIFNNGTAGHMGTLGNMIILVAVCSFSLYAVVSKRMLKNLSPMYVNNVFMIVTACALFPFFVWDLVIHPAWWMHVQQAAVWGTLYVAIVGTVIFYLLYQYAIKHSTPVIATLIQFIMPVTVYIWAFFLLDERLTANFLIGAVFVFAGAWLTTRSR